MGKKQNLRNKKEMQNNKSTWNHDLFDTMIKEAARLPFVVCPAVLRQWFAAPRDR